jgi:hypothetical protein
MLASDPAGILEQIFGRAGIPLTQESTKDDHALSWPSWVGDTSPGSEGFGVRKSPKTQSDTRRPLLSEPMSSISRCLMVCRSRKSMDFPLPLPRFCRGLGSGSGKSRGAVPFKLDLVCCG